MASLLTALADRVERVSRQVVWQTTMEKAASLQGLYEVGGDWTRPAGVAFHGLGLAHLRSGWIVEAYAHADGAGRRRARRSLAAQLAIPESAVSVVPCRGFIPYVLAGDGGGHQSLVNNGSWGTIGGFAHDLLGSLLLAVSNNHVFAANNRASIGDGLYTPNPVGQFGGLHRFSPLLAQPHVNVLDGAVGWIHDRQEIRSFRVNGARPATAGLRVKKTGARTGRTTGTIVSMAATAVVGYDGLGNLNFRRCLRIVGDGEPFSLPGDSGSLVLDMNNFVVGIIFAGDVDGGHSLANPANILTSGLEIAF